MIGGDKKQKKRKNAKKRVLIPFNTGERVHASERDYNRRRLKEDLRREAESDPV